MTQLRNLAIAATLVALTACTAAQDSSTGDPSPGGPSASQVLSVTEDFSLAYLEGVELLEREWDIELEYDVQDVSSVYSHYHDIWIGAGFVRGELEVESDEIEAEYAHADGRRAEIEVELDDGRTEVALQLDDPSTVADPDPITTRGLGTLEIPLFDAEVVEIEWEIEIDYPASATTVQDAYDFYHDALTNLGWVVTEGESEWDEIEADYYDKDGVELELEVELDDGRIEVEIELDKDRFYD